MSKPTTITTEEMLEFIDEVRNGWTWQPEEDAIFDAIRSSLRRLDALKKFVEELRGEEEK